MLQKAGCPNPGVGKLARENSPSAHLYNFRIGGKYSSVRREIDSAFRIQKNFSGSNTDGSFTTAISNSFFESQTKQKIP